MTNETLEDCLTSAVDIASLNYSQRFTLTTIDVMLLVTNAVANVLVIYVLINTKQLTSVSCKFLLMLSLTDILIALFTQSLFIVVLFETKCRVKIASQFVSAFLSRVSSYTVAVIGVDRFIRIKYRMNYMSILTNAFATILMLLAFFLALIQATVITVGLLINKEQSVRSVGMAIDGSVVLFVLLLQVATMKIIRRINSQIRPDSSHILQEANKKITKLCSRIMVLLVLFITPFLIVSFIRNRIRHQLHTEQKSVLEFIFRLSMLFAYTNSLANALLFLTTNIRGKKFLNKKLGLTSESRSRDTVMKENRTVSNINNYLNTE